MPAKELKHEFLRETDCQKYFLVKRSDGEYFVFRAPGKSEDKSKDRTTLLDWEGEIVGWGNVPKKIRKLILRKNLKLLESNQKAIVPK